MHEVCRGSLRKLVPISVEKWVLLHYTAVQEPGQCFLSCRHEALRHKLGTRVAKPSEQTKTTTRLTTTRRMWTKGTAR
jgi:hypothetical protein